MFAWNRGAGAGRWWSRLAGGERRRRIDREDALRHLYHSEEAGLAATVDSLAGACRRGPDGAASTLEELQACGWVTWQERRVVLSDDGRQQAMQVVRAHRLWERHLAERTGVPAGRWHRQADAAEHDLEPAETERLAARLGHPTFDPHGDPIPTAAGDLPATAAQTPATDLAVGQRAVITHVEDEPEGVHERLLAAGLFAGAGIERRESGQNDLCLVDDRGITHHLDPPMAAALSVTPAAPVRPARPLSEVEVGGAVRVQALAPDCRGLERRRLLDLGIVPGTVLHVEHRAATGDPTAYRIRGSVVALRREQAQRILVQAPPA